MRAFHICSNKFRHNYRPADMHVNNATLCKCLWVCGVRTPCAGGVVGDLPVAIPCGTEGFGEHRDGMT